MKIFIITSDNYSHLIKPNSILFEKYWANQEIRVLHYNKLHSSVKDLPENWELINLGEQSKYWTTPLIEYFKFIEDEYFMICLDDMLLVDYVDENKVRKLEEEIKNGRADKAMFHFYDSNEQVNFEENGFVELKQDCQYRLGLHPAIWTKEYWLKNLQSELFIWDFEIQKEAFNDGAKIILLRECKYPSSPIFHTINIYRNGKMADLVMRTPIIKNGFVHREDIPLVANLIKEFEYRDEGLYSDYKKKRLK
jgi:hypothetical protein